MKVFGHLARCYDLLYADKDYGGEVRFVHEIIQRHAPGARTILELGCGTGAHAVHLVKEGYEIHGVDLSAEMLARAGERLAQLPPELAVGLTFSQGDLRTLRLGRTFDAVIALFHVLSYQPTNHDLQAAFATAKEHLHPGGVFIFDFWYGPAVLTDRPAVRIKRVEDEVISVTRIAEPVLQVNDNLVEVHYHFFLQDKAAGAFATFQESHRMRYLFKPEIDRLLAEYEFTSLELRGWLTGREPGADTWNVYAVGRK
jgi:SAM-dependent methyltransferase